MAPPRPTPSGTDADTAHRIVRTKLGVPALQPDVVSRARLLHRLDQDGARVILVSAPAGSGKTVLVSDWLHRSARPATWLSLDRLDNDPGRFYSHFAAALRDLDTPQFHEAAAIAEALARTGGDPAVSLIPTLAQEDRSAVLVLDEVHALEAPPLLRLLTALVDGLQEGPRLVLVTRVDPPVPMGRLRLSGALLEIRQRDLRFDGDETLELFRRSLPYELRPELVGRLEERTEGWAAGLRMAAVALQRVDDPEAAIEAFAGSHEWIVDYLMEEVLRGQEEPVQRFLMETSILPRFTAEGCAAVTGDPAARHHLRVVEEANLFLVALDPRQQWYRYHHLFSELLEFRLRTLRPDRVAGLHERASRWFEAQGDIQEAMGQAARMEDRNRLLELLDRHGYPILARSEFGSFARWLNHVPEPLSQRAPMFLVALAWFRAQTERAPRLDEILGALEVAVDDPPPGYPEDRIRQARLHLGALRAFTLRVVERFDEALEVGERVLAELPSDAVMIRGILEFNMGAVHLRLLNTEPARRHLESGYELCLQSGVPYLVLATLGHLGALTAQTEGLAAARQQLEGAVAFAEEEGLAGVPAFAIILYQLAQVHYLADELTDARVHLERAVSLTRGERETDIRANVLIHFARVEAADGAFERAEELLATASGLAFAHNVTPFATTLAVERGRLAEQRNGQLLTPQELPSTEADSVSWSSHMEAEFVLKLQHALQLDLRETAGEFASRLRRESENRGRGVPLCIALVAQAALSADAGERKTLLARGLQLAARRGYVRPLVDGGAPVRALVESGLGHPLPEPARTFVRTRLLPRMPAGQGVLTAPGVPTTPGADGSDLTDREMETLELLARGLTNAAMARELYISVNTVKTHLKHLFAKLGVSTRTAAVREARSRGLLPRSSD